MSATDLNVDLGFFRHPKTVRLVARLGRGAEVLPLKLWCHCGEYHAETGRLAGYTIQEIEQIIGWWGKEGDCVQAMLAVGFLEKEGDDWVAHDFIKHQGHIAALKRKAKSMAAARWNRMADADSNAHSNAGSNPPTNHPSIPSIPTPPPSPPPDPRPPDVGGDGVVGLVKAACYGSGINEPTASEVAAIPGILPIHVIVANEEAKAAKAKNPPGATVVRLRSTLPRVVEPRLLCRLHREGIVRSFRGMTIQAWNRNGLIVRRGDLEFAVKPDEVLCEDVVVTGLDPGASGKE